VLLGDVLLPLLFLDRSSCLRPQRFEVTYSQMRPRFAQREHVGFSLEHFNLEDAQTWQLSRNLGAAGAVDRRPSDDEGVGSAGGGECIAAIVLIGGNVSAETRLRRKWWEIDKFEGQERYT